MAKESGHIRVGELVVLSSLTGQLPAETRLVDCTGEILQNPGKLEGGFIPRGSGCSFGDASYIKGGHTLQTHPLTGISDFDVERGEVTAGAGVVLRDLADHVEAQGWMLPTAGGTGWVTVGGGVASDIHGKNDPAVGSFGNHIASLEVVTGAGEVIPCGPDRNQDLFSATVGGMGLTGVVRSARLRLMPLGSGAVRWQNQTARSMTELTELFRACSAPYQAAWVNLMGRKMQGIHHQASFVEQQRPAPSPSLNIKLPYMSVLSPAMVRGINGTIYRLQRRMDRRVNVRDFVWSVDQVQHWHRLFGRKGFTEFQFSVPEQTAAAALEAIESEGRREGILPYFAMVKHFGDHERAGLLSFPSAGFTYTADYPLHPRNLRFFNRFTERVMAWGGRFSLAKDATLTPEQVAAVYPRLKRWQKIVKKYDPGHRVRSDLSNRLALKPW